MRPSDTGANTQTLGVAHAFHVLTEVPSLDGQTFTYLPPRQNALIQPGSLVRVPLHGRTVRGWVVDIVHLTEVEPELRARLRPIKSVLGSHPIASPTTLQLARWAATEYAGSAPVILHWATPAPLPGGRAQRRLPQKPVNSVRQSARVPVLSAAISAGRRFEAFIRTWPADDATSTILPLAAAVPDGRMTLVIAPAGRTPRLTDAVFLSGQKTAHATRAWEEAVAGNARILVTGRRGPFVPLSNLGLIILTSEHCSTHKDEQTPSLDARLVARELARQKNIPYVAIGPSSPLGPEGVITSFRGWPRGSEKTAPPFQNLTVPGTPTRWPRMEMVSLADTPPGTGALSTRFFTAIGEALAEKKRIFLFLNRKGAARALVCRNCNAPAACDRCDGLLQSRHKQKPQEKQPSPPTTIAAEPEIPGSLSSQSLAGNLSSSVPKSFDGPQAGIATPLRAAATPQTKENPPEEEMVCRQCQRIFPFVACLCCGASRVRSLGIGIDKLSSELAKAFPGTQVRRAEGTEVPEAMPGEIMVGTQAAFRHRQTFDLVVLIDPDAMLRQAGLRAEEAAFHLLLDAIATAKSRQEHGSVLIQTRRPDHPAIQALLTRDPSQFEKAALAAREALALAPFRRMIKVSTSDFAALEKFAAALQKTGVEILGLAATPRPHTLILVTEKVWTETVRQARAAKTALSGTRLRVEIDPLNP